MICLQNELDGIETLACETVGWKQPKWWTWGSCVSVCKANGCQEEFLAAYCP